jgi:large subunit ribosomal protein L18|tara:strand:- start:269 stop:619 length:351 start_codon:yes stop_codon:yes gene_type:complete
MSIKNIKRQKRALKTRSKINQLEKNRLTVFRSNNHIYAQIISNGGADVLATASTVESTIKDKNNGNLEAAAKVGKLIAERALERGIQDVAFDRSGYKFHGRVKALAEAAREAGLSF